MILQSFVSKLMGKTNIPVAFRSGALLDSRTTEQKQRDFRPEEAFAMASDTMAVNWVSKTLEQMERDIKSTSINQYATSRCVSEYAGIALETAEYKETGQRVVFSRRDVYSRRANRPYGGMAMHDLFKIMLDGACAESQLPSNLKTEDEINKPYTVTPAMVTIRKKYASGSSFEFDMKERPSIDKVAYMLEQGIPVCLFWYFDSSGYNEWWGSNPVVLNHSIDIYDISTARHQATAVDYFMFNGAKHLLVMDSAGQGTGLGIKKNLRMVSEDFFNSRCYAIGFSIDKKNLDYTPSSDFKYTFTKPIQFGDSGPDVVALQKILVLEGCLNIKSPTGLFRGMTRAAVIKLQEKYANEILVPAQLKKGTGRVLTNTLNFLNKKYSL